MTEREHKEKHRQLHEALDELLADFIEHSEDSSTLLCTPIIKLMEWSSKQVKEPDHDPSTGGPFGPYEQEGGI